MDSLTGDLATAARIPFEKIDHNTRRRAKHLFLDWLGCAVAGAAEPASSAVRDVIIAEGSRAQATLVGTPYRGSASQAALFNGVAAHVLDYDDGSSWMNGHVGAPTCSAAVALAEQTGATTTEVLTAIVAGVDVACMLGLAMGTGHYAAGWHPTATIGTISAAAAAGAVAGLGHQELVWALGLAASRASGVKASFGSMAKSWQTGHAASTGVLVAQLAKAGLTANLLTIEGPGGLAATQTTTFMPGRYRELMDGRRGLESVIFKKHACCAGTHSTVDGLRELSATQSFAAGDVREVILHVTRQQLSTCAIPTPRSGLEGKFSLRYAAALALSGRSTGPASFTDDHVHDPQLTTLMERCRLVDNGQPSGAAIDIEVKLSDGRVLTAHRDPAQPVNDASLDREWLELTRKFCDLAGPVIGDSAAANVRSLVDEMDEPTPLTRILQLVRPRPDLTSALALVKLQTRAALPSAHR